MSQMQLQPDDPIGPLDWRKVIPFQAVAASDRLGWVGLEAARFRASPAWEYTAPALTHHRLVLVTRPPQELDLRFEGVKRHVPPPPERSYWCRPALGARCAGEGASTGFTFIWSRGWSSGWPPRRSTSIRRG
jgi:hypothetical protein